jgi:cytochrome c oxidase subunit II
MRVQLAFLVGVIVSIAGMTPIPPVRTSQPVHEMQVTARRFTFEPATIQVVAGEPVRLVLRSADAVHGFAIHDLKIDLQIPKGGVPVTVEFTAPAAGRYEIACSEYCGSGHGQMKAALVSVAPTRTDR